MELGVIITLAAVGVALAWFWMDGVASGERRMGHRP
jgi:hypothetical protein